MPLDKLDKRVAQHQEETSSIEPLILVYHDEKDVRERYRDGVGRKKRSSSLRVANQNETSSASEAAGHRRIGKDSRTEKGLFALSSSLSFLLANVTSDDRAGMFIFPEGATATGGQLYNAHGLLPWPDNH